MEPLKVFVPKYVKKFLIKEYGREPIYTRADSHIGRLLQLTRFESDESEIDDYDLVENYKKRKDEKNGNNLVKVGFDITFRVRNGFFTEQLVMKFIEVLEVEFEKALYFWVKGMMAKGVKETPAVNRFLEYYDIDENDGLKPNTAVVIVNRKNKKLKD